MTRWDWDKARRLDTAGPKTDPLQELHKLMVERSSTPDRHRHCHATKASDVLERATGSEADKGVAILSKGLRELELVCRRAKESERSAYLELLEAADQWLGYGVGFEIEDSCFEAAYTALGLVPGRLSASDSYRVGTKAREIAHDRIIAMALADQNFRTKHRTKCDALDEATRNVDSLMIEVEAVRKAIADPASLATWQPGNQGRR